MNFLTRNKSWIVLLWVIVVLLFFKFYNNFNFENNESIFFIIAILIVPVTLTVISNITYNKNKRDFNNNQNKFKL